MKTLIRLLMCGALLCSFCVNCEAGSQYRIDLKDYRIRKRLGRVVLRRQISTQYPTLFHHLTQRGLNFLDNSVLQQDGPAEQLVERLLERVAESEAASAELERLTIAKSTVDPNHLGLADLRNRARALNGLPPISVDPPRDTRTGLDADHDYFENEVGFPPSN